MQIETIEPFDQGVITANAIANGRSPEAEAEEAADVKRWSNLITEARKFDEAARKQYAIDRRYARADRTHFEVQVPIAQSYIDVLRSFLYARDPDVNVTPSGFTQPPPQKDIIAMVAERIQASNGQSSMGLPPAIAQALGTQGGQPQAGGMPGAPPPPQLPTPPTMTGDDPDSVIQQQAAALLKPYQRLRDDAKQLSTTLELVISSLWKKAKLKSQAKPLVGSGLSVGIGWFKAMWLERMGKDPVIQRQLDDIAEQLARIASTHRELAAGEGDEDQLRVDFHQQQTALEAKVDVMVARGFAIDFVPAEHIQVATDCRDMSSYLDASWIAHCVYMPVSQAKADYPEVARKLDKAAVYYPMKPRDASTAHDSAMVDSNVNAREADTYRKGGEGNDGGTMTSGEAFVCLWEVWNRDGSNVITFFDAMDCYARAPYNPTPATTRFYPFFQFIVGAVDGERHPRSLTTRSTKLFDEYDSVRSGYRKHRRRVIPKTGFDATNYTHDEIEKLERAETGEMVGLKPTRPGEPIANALAEIKYPAVDMALYDTSAIRAELEMIWGVQEALSSSIHVAKTATEAELQQQGTESRTGYMRDGLDDMLTDLAQYTAEVALQKMSAKDVEAIAGPWALWPEGMTIEDMASLVQVSIHAGSTGKPNTTAQRQAWGQVMPVVSQAIEKIGQLRGSSPDEIADCIEALVTETIDRTGDRVDASRFMPDPPRTPPPPPPKGPAQPLDQSALAGTQIAQLLAILVDVRGGALAPLAAVALIQASCPAVPGELVNSMVEASAPQPGDGPTDIHAPHASAAAPPMPANAPAPDFVQE